MESSRRTSPFFTFWLPLILIMLVGLTLRLVRNMTLPLFIDEALHLDRAYHGLEGQIYYWNIRKWLYPVFLSVFRLGGPEGPWTARAISALLGAFSIAGCAALGRSLANQRVGLLAALLYAVLPLAIFHERQALADPLLSALLLLVTILSIHLARRPRWWHGVLIGAALAAAYLTKISALPYVAVPFVAIILFGKRETRWPSLAISLAALIIAIAVIARTYDYVLAQGGRPERFLDITTEKFMELLALSGGGQPAGLLPRLLGGFSFAGSVIPISLGFGLCALVVTAVVLALRGYQRRETIFLAVPGIVLAFAPMIADRPLDASRYFLPNAAALVTLAALAWHGIVIQLPLSPTRSASDDVRGRGGWGVRALSSLLAALIFIAALWFDVALIANPESAPLTRTDSTQYFNNVPSGTAYSVLAEELLEYWQRSGRPRMDVISTGEAAWLKAYLGPRVGEFAGYVADDPDQRRIIAGWLAQGDQVFFVEDTLGEPLPDMPYGAILIPSGRVISSFRSLEYFEVMGAQGTLAEEIYALSIPDPAQIQADFAALAADSGLSSTLAIFPSTYSSEVLSLPLTEIVPLSLDTTWPLNTYTVYQALDTLESNRYLNRIDFVSIDEANSDPQRIFALALQSRYYFVEEEWYGVLHRRVYQVGWADPTISPINAIFEGGITLEGAYFENPPPDVSAPILVVLRWSTPAHINDSFNVFLHIVDSSGNLVAQYDAIPGAGLLPMTSWEPNVSIEDRFAIQSNLYAGIYEIQVGIYNPISGLRLPVISAPQHNGDYIVLKTLEVIDANP